MIDPAPATLLALAARYKVIVVDDGGTDATAAVAEDWLRRHDPAVRLLAHDGNPGYGAAIGTGTTPLLRLFVSWVYNRTVGLLVWVRDVDCAFKLMRREILDT